jgi:hypothetical protein
VVGDQVPVGGRHQIGLDGVDAELAGRCIALERVVG